MSLTVETKAGQKDTKSAALLNKYLSGAVAKMDGMTKKDATKVADKFAAQKAQGIELADVTAKEADVNEGLKKFGLKEKLNYASDAKAYNEDIQKSVDTMVMTGVMSVASTLTLAVATTSTPEQGATLGAVAGVVLTAATLERLAKAGMRAVSAPRNEEQAKKVDEYTELKHTQLALKQLKNVLTAPEREAQKAKDKEMVRQLYASGLGNPGGMITPISLAKGKGSR